jgi:dienelactone hydrolase
MLNARSIPYTEGGTPLTGYLVSDETRTDPGPGVLVVHGGAGLDEHAKGRARRLAALGFVVFACDIYGDGVAGDRGRVMARIKEFNDDRSRLRTRAQAGIDVLRSQPLVDGRVAAVGYCFGGMTVLELARGGADLEGVVSVHGSLHTPQPAGPSAVKAKVLVCHGALDPHVPMPHVTAFVEEMKQAGADWQLIMYGDAMHGFTHETATGRETPGVAYHALTDARSSAAIEQFFQEIFGAASMSVGSSPTV